MINWIAIKNDYINGVGNYRELSEKYEVSPDTIRKRASAEKWRDERTKYTQNVHKMSQEKSAGALSDELLTKIQLRIRLLKLGEAWLNSIDEITDTADFRRMVQCFAEMGVFDKDVSELGKGVVDDPLTRALKEEAERLNNIYYIEIG